MTARAAIGSSPDSAAARSPIGRGDVVRGYSAATARRWGVLPIAPRRRWCDAQSVTQVAEEQTFERLSFDQIEDDRRANPDGRRSSDRPFAANGPHPAPVRLPFRQRYALRDPIAYAVEAPEGEIGFVIGMWIAPFEYWPDELIVATPEGHLLRVPISTVDAVLVREGRLLLTGAPAGAQPVPRPHKPSLTVGLAWRLAAVAGALLGLGGYVATFVALALGSGLDWAPGLAASGAAGGSAAAVSWRKAGPSWFAAAGLGSFWLPLAAGAILSLVLIFR